MEDVPCNTRSAAAHNDVADVGSHIIDGDPFISMRFTVGIHRLDDIDGLTVISPVFCSRNNLFFNSCEEHQAIVSTNSTMLALTGAKPLSNACVASVLVT